MKLFSEFRIKRDITRHIALKFAKNQISAKKKIFVNKLMEEP